VKLGFHPSAEAEHLEQVAWYEARQPGLGAHYLADIQRTLQAVCKSPTRFPLVRAPDIRRAGTSAFPFGIMFRVRADGIEVLAVSHHRRRPTHWLGRV
jgi:plasmid stabilization system protein ParE